MILNQMVREMENETMMVVVYILLVYWGQVNGKLSVRDENVCKSSRGLECCFGYILSQDGSRCEDCPSGYHGYECKFRCSFPKYGVKCKRKCYCSRDLCDYKDGCIPKLATTDGHMDTTFKNEDKIQTTTIQEETVSDQTSVSGYSGNNSITDFRKSLFVNDKSAQVNEVFPTIYSVLGSLTLVCLMLMMVSVFSLCKRHKQLSLPVLPDNTYSSIDERQLLSPADGLHLSSNNNRRLLSSTDNRICSFIDDQKLVSPSNDRHALSSTDNRHLLSSTDDQQRLATMVVHKLTQHSKMQDEEYLEPCYAHVESPYDYAYEVCAGDSYCQVYTSVDHTYKDLNSYETDNGITYPEHTYTDLQLTLIQQGEKKNNNVSEV